MTHGRLIREHRDDGIGVEIWWRKSRTVHDDIIPSDEGVANGYDLDQCEDHNQMGCRNQETNSFHLVTCVYIQYCNTQ